MINYIRNAIRRFTDRSLLDALNKSIAVPSGLHKARFNIPVVLGEIELANSKLTNLNSDDAKKLLSTIPQMMFRLHQAEMLVYDLRQNLSRIVFRSDSRVLRIADRSTRKVLLERLIECEHLLDTAIRCKAALVRQNLTLHEYSISKFPELPEDLTQSINSELPIKNTNSILRFLMDRLIGIGHVVSQLEPSIDLPMFDTAPANLDDALERLQGFRLGKLEYIGQRRIRLIKRAQRLVILKVVGVSEIFFAPLISPLAVMHLRLWELLVLELDEILRWVQISEARGSLYQAILVLVESSSD